jgi:hypothetical protein
MTSNIRPALKQYAAGCMRRAQDRAEKARAAADVATEQAEGAKVYADGVATNFEFFEPVISIGVYRCPKCWVENRQDNNLQSTDDLEVAFHCDACGEDFKTEAS